MWESGVIAKKNAGESPASTQFLLELSCSELHRAGSRLDARLAAGFGLEDLLQVARVGGTAGTGFRREFAAFEHQLDFGGVERLTFQQRLRHALQPFLMVGEDVDGRPVALVDEAAN